MITRILAGVLGVVLAFSPLQVLPGKAAPIPLQVFSSIPLAGLTTTSSGSAVVVTSEQRQVVAQAPPATQREESFVASAVNRVGAAVVRIDTERTITRNPDPFLSDPFFRQFFGNSLPAQPYEERLQGQGSGFIVDGNGTILTNAHVVEGADRVTVTLKDGRRLDGSVQGVDEVTDMAVVKISVQGGELPTAPLGNSDQVAVGDWAIAVGNPLGLDNTVTLGIVSTLNRSSALVGIPDKRLDFIQTDAAINPGNSGGPLLNARGEVIGINTAIRANAMGIGFAIPINKAKEIMPRLARGEKIVHPYLGIQIANLTPDLARRNNNDPNSTIRLPEVSGVLVTGVIPSSPAASAGVRRGDVITQIEGQAITAADQLQSMVDQSQLGQSLKITLKRGDRTQQLSVRTAALQQTNPS
jgi:S1-C subfamily serine protease